MATIYFLMGVAGVGKTTIGKIWAKQLNLPFIDADDLHSDSNIEKMKRGIALSDEDRWPWLTKVHSAAVAEGSTKGAVIACSALKAKYRALLVGGLPEAYWFFLDANKETIQDRLKTRQHHYMPASLLESQLATLEIPEEAIHIDTSLSLDEIILFMQQSVALRNARIGVIGLGIMGTAISRNMAEKGWQLSIYNREVPDKEESVAKHATEVYPILSTALAFNELTAFVKSLGKKQYIFMMLPAGEATTMLIKALMPLLSAGAIIIDGANAFYKDTEMLQKQLAIKGIHLLGCGVSGGEKGALKGPAMMVSGNKQAFEVVAPLLKCIAARNGSGNSCCKYIGSEGSGHYVKMVHNAIEYGEMQLVAEIYSLLSIGLALDDASIATIFKQWNETDLESYLLQISGDILATKHNGAPIVSLISDKAYAKGTGSWATQEAAKLGVPSGMFTVALNTRFLSGNLAVREWVQQYIGVINKNMNTSPIDISLELIEEVYKLVRIWNHQQGFALIMAAAKEYGWPTVSLATITDGWRAGCIIRSTLMDILAAGFTTTDNLLEIDYCKRVMKNNYSSLVKLAANSMEAEIPIPIISEALQSILQYKQKVLATSLIQAQRDYFGAHGFKWKNKDTDNFQHHNWEF
jgi:6-phosphogluconate dehydrogenase